jgi:hypothetical protein
MQQKTHHSIKPELDLLLLYNLFVSVDNYMMMAHSLSLILYCFLFTLVQLGKRSRRIELQLQDALFT